MFGPGKRKLSAVCEESETLQCKRQFDIKNGSNFMTFEESGGNSLKDEYQDMELRDSLLDGALHDSDGSTNDVVIDEPILCAEKPTEDRIVIKMNGKLPNLSLPDGWLALNHRSGGIIYLHRPTRVCTWSRPYHIGSGSVRKHDIPAAAIPCFHQMRSLACQSPEDSGLPPDKDNVLTTLNTTWNENNGSTDDKVEDFSCVSPTETKSPEREELCALEEASPCPDRTKVSSAVDNSSYEMKIKDTCALNKQSQFKYNVFSKSGIELIDGDTLHSYLSNIFEFQNVTHEQEQNLCCSSSQMNISETEVPAILESLPYSFKGVDVNNKQPKEWVINPGGKTPVAILHEYAQRELKVKPEYSHTEGNNAATPFVAEVRISGMVYGKGEGASKRLAKQHAAETALEVLIPEVFNKISNHEITSEEHQIFDKLKIDDSKVFEVTTKSGSLSPYHILQECLKRKQGVYQSTIDFKMKPEPDQRQHTYEITCAGHTATGFCKNKKIGRQLAAQAILKKLHPHIKTWGALLRIYSERPSSVVKKSPPEDQLLTRPHALSAGAHRGQLLLNPSKKKCPNCLHPKTRFQLR
uniref:Pasha/DGCR8 n=1 Tax=Nematostella vectensis TaxID=45351 RepID=U3MIG6_NEMVE|nr:pasha/DGCR8 [Nematostella vectensis]